LKKSKYFSFIIIVLATILVVTLASCSNGDEEGFGQEPLPPNAIPGVDTDDKRDGSSAMDIGDEQLIVRNGDIELVVENVSEAAKQIESLVQGFDGFIVSSRFWNDGNDLMGYYSVRVPDESFDAAMTALGNLAVEVESQSTNSYDVTQEYIDLDARLRNAEATESQYLALLERAVSVQDTVQIYQSLSQVRAEIEQLKARMLYLETITSTSLINISLEPEKSSEPLVIGDWSIGDAFKSVIRGVVTFGQWMVTGLMWVGIFSPIWGGILAWFLIRRRKKQLSN
jgi:hypothetical protein